MAYTGPQFVGTPTTVENQFNGTLSTPAGATIGESLFVFVKGRIGAVGDGAATEDFTLTGFTYLGGSVEDGGQFKSGAFIKTVDAADVAGTTYTMGATNNDVFSGYAWCTRVSQVVTMAVGEFDIDESSVSWPIPVMAAPANSLALACMGPSSNDQEPPPSPWTNAGGIDNNVRIGSLESEFAGNVGGETWSSLSFNNGYKCLAVVLEGSGGGTPVPTGQVALATEVELGFVGVTPAVITPAVGQLDTIATETEVDFVGSTTRSGTLDVATETEVDFTARSDRAGQLGLDTRVAIAFEGRTPAGGQFGLDGEVELDFAGRSARSGALALAGETEVDFVGLTDRAGGLDLVGETELGFVGRAAGSGALGLGTSTTLSFLGIAPGGGGRLGLDAETEVDFVGSTSRVGQLDSLAAGTALAFVARSGRAGVLGLDTRTALAFVGRRPTLNTGFGLASRTALAFTGRTPRRGSLDLVSEVDLTVAGQVARAGSLALSTEAVLAFFVAILGTHPRARSTSSATSVAVYGAPDGTTVFGFTRGLSTVYVEHPDWLLWTGNPADLVLADVD